MSSKEIKVNGKTYKVLYTFVIAHIGWEMDNEGWICEDDAGKKVFITTNHGCLCFENVTNLRELIDDEECRLYKMRVALEILENKL